VRYAVLCNSVANDQRKITVDPAIRALHEKLQP
jgi:hypothetical protein